MDQRAGDRDPLQLAAAQLLRQARAEAGEADGVEHARHAPVVALREQHQRQRDVLRHVQVRQHVESLEHEADMLAAPQRARLGVERADVGAVVPHRAGIPAVEAGHAVEQGRFADARFAHDRDELAVGDIERDVLEHRYFAVVLAEVPDLQCHASVATWRSTWAMASAASAGITRRPGMLRSQVICRLASWRVAAMPRSRSSAIGQAPSSASQVCR